MNNKSLLKVLAVILALGLFISYVPASVTAQNTPPQAVTVEPAVLELIEKNGEASYWVDFEQTVDLSSAYQMEWSDRGWFVYNTLKAQADKSQATAISVLEASGLSYESFWITNRIFVKDSNRTVLASLQQLPGVVAIRAPKTFFIDEPEVSYTEPMAIEANIQHVNAPDVWDLGYTGVGYTVANIDTGVRLTHQAVVNQYRGNNGGTFTHDYNWRDPYNNHVTPADDNGHGTHTMGTMVGNDGGANQIGMAPGAEWMACRGCNTSSCTDTALLTCAEFIAAPTRVDGTEPDPDLRPDVVNNSWGDCGQSYDGWYQGVVDAWHAAGVYPVFSNGNAGNCGYNSPPGLNTVGNPARYGNVTGVGSTGRSNGTYATHSNWGPTDNPDTVNPTDSFANLKPQVLAPGVSIRSSVNTGDSAYASYSGTSMSAPHVAGLLALMYQAAPCLVGDYAATETIIESTAVDMVYNDGSNLTPTDFPNFATGWGEIDALAAVQYAAGACGTSVLTGTVVSDSNQPVASAKITITGTSAANNRTVYTNASGVYSANVSADTYSITASAYGFLPETVDDITVEDEETVTQDFILEELPNAVVYGVVYDGGVPEGTSHGYPLYAKVTFSMSGYSETVYTDPFTGEYEITVYNNQDYNVSVEAMLPGYDIIQTVVNAGIEDLFEQDFYLDIDLAGCSAPGYAPNYDVYFDWESGPQGFESGGTNSSWAHGEFTSGPGATHSGTYGIATNPAGTYNVSEQSWMASQNIDMTAFVQVGDVPVIEFWQWVWTESATSTWDQISVQVSKNGGTTWDTVYGPTQRQDTAWNKVTLVLDQSYVVNNFRIRFYFKSDSSVVKDGWYVDDLGIAAFTPPPMTVAYSEDFEADNGGYVPSVEAGGTGTNSWAWGTPTAHGTYPGGAHSGSKLWATGLGAVYNPNERSLLTSPDIDLSEFEDLGLAPTLQFWHWMDSESNTWDWGEVRVSKDGGATYTTIYQKFNDKMVWTKEQFVLDPSYAVSNFKIQFFLRSDSSGQYAGWFIDDISIFVSEPYTVSVPCGTIDGGLVGGYVFDANFPTEKLMGARVQTETAADVTALDAGNPAQDGLYMFFQATTGSPEEVEFTASKSKYETVVETHEIEQDVVNHIDFELGTGMIVADPLELTRTIQLHDDPETTTLTLINQGAGGANFTITEQDAGMQPYYIPPFTGEIEKSDVPASIFRDPNAAETTGELVLDLNSSRYGITQAPPAYGVDLFTDTVYLWPDASVPGTTELIGTPGPTSLFAGDFLGGDFSTLYVVSYDNNKLYAVDTATAAATEIGTTIPPTGTFSGLAGAGNIMYGVAVECGSQSILTTIDVATAEVTTIGPISNSACLIDLSYVPDTGMLYGVDLVTDEFIMIDPATGAGTVVGSTGTAANYAQGMDYDEENNIFYWAAYTSGPELRIIDINTGASVAVGSFTLGEVDSFAIAAGGGGDVPWLSEDPIEGYVPANSEFEVDVTFDVSGIEQPGWYYAFLKISTDTPYAVPDIPVSLHVVRPLNYGNIKGTVTGTGKCDVDPLPIEKATVNFYENGELAFTTKTNEEGYYSYSLKHGTYDVEILADGYVDFMQTGVVVGWDEDVTVDAVLRLFAPCLTVVPESYYQELFPNETATQTMTLLNTGAAEAVFEISERPGDGPVPFADYEFIVDDGSLEDSVGLTAGGDFIWGNYFTVSDDILPFSLSTVQIMWNDSIAASDQVSVLVYHDPDRDPSNGANFVAQIHSTVQVNDGLTWVNYEFDDALITEPGNILLAAVNRSGASGYSDYPAGMDTNASKGKSWIGLYNSSVPEIPTLPADNTWATIDELGLPGNWMIRGLGTAGSADIIWLEEDPLADVVFPDGGTREVTLTFDSTDLVWGDYFGTLAIKNDPDPRINVPVQLRVKAYNTQYLPLILRNFPVPGQR